MSFKCIYIFMLFSSIVCKIALYTQLQNSQKTSSNSKTVKEIERGDDATLDSYFFNIEYITLTTFVYCNALVQNFLL